MAGSDPHDALGRTGAARGGKAARRGGAAWGIGAARGSGAARIGRPGPGRGFAFALDRLSLACGASLEREMEAARGLPWLAVAFAGGTLAYFALPSEPVAAALALLAIVLALAAIRLAAGSVGLFRLVLVAALIVAGATAAKLRTDWLATPVLERPVTATVTGWVEGREARRGGYRLTIRAARIEGARLTRPPARLTATVRGEAPRVGEGVSLLARLRPPSGPVLPGSYDFARNAFYAGIGATGFAYGAPKPADPGPAPLSIRLRVPLEALREAIRSRILAALPGDTGRIATALVIGDAGGLSREAEDDMRQSGLAHVLSVSGLHMVLVAGAAFWMIRAALALVPSLALRRPIKKWAAAGALGVTFFYLLISGLDVAAQRSFVMTAIVFAAIIVERRAISMRNVAIAAFIVLLLAPESILDAGFQMSFAATIALVAGFEALARRSRRRRRLAGETGLIGRTAGFLLALVGGLALTSLLGGIGTTPFALYHFQRMAPLSIVANVLAMPLIDFLVMPLALGAVLLMPFGLDQPLLMLMGTGIDGMLAIAARVSAWSEGSGGAAMPTAAALLIFVAGFLWLTLMGERWRLAGLVPMLVGGMLALMPQRPDLIVSASGRAVAIRAADGRYTVLAPKLDRFETGIWLRADGDPRLVTDPSLTIGTACDGSGCIGRLPDGRIVALSLDRDAFAEDCRRAALVVTPLDAPAACAMTAAIADRGRLARFGALALAIRPEILKAAGEHAGRKARAPPGSDPLSTGMALPVDEASEPIEAEQDEPSQATRHRTHPPDDTLPDAGETPTDAGNTTTENGEAAPDTTSPRIAAPDTATRIASATDPAAAMNDDRLAALFAVTETYPAIRRAWMPPLDPPR